jgi:hypothetical protein
LFEIWYIPEIEITGSLYILVGLKRCSIFIQAFLSSSRTGSFFSNR